MIRRRAEHNECILYTLEELVLQEEGIERIDATLGTLCQHLKILYMPNNLISRLENMYRLKELQYLNLAMNNIAKVEGLQHCEALEKLDLTLNFVDLQHLPSVQSLSANVHLHDLFLTGNPCSDWDGYRKYVIANLPRLKRLDAWEIKPRERIAALQEIHQLEQELGVKINAPSESEKKTEAYKNKDGEPVREYTAATRVAEHNELRELREQEAKKSTRPDPFAKPSKRRSGFEPLPTEGRIYQRNEGGWEFKLTESDCGTKLVLDVAAGKYLDTSLIDVDVQPTLVRVLIKGKLLQLRLPDEVKTDASVAERSTITGHLVVQMPLLKGIVRVQPQTYLSSGPTNSRTKTLQLEVVNIQNIVKDAAATSDPPTSAHSDNVIEPPQNKASDPDDTLTNLCDEGVPPLE